MIHILIFLIVLSIVVIVHEGGHFMMARLCGVQVLKFSVGFGPVLCSRQDKKGTIWQLCAIPLGGYVQMLGDEDAASMKKDIKKLTPEQQKKTFMAQPLWKRALIIFFGPAMNYIFAIIVLTILFYVKGHIGLPPKIAEVLPNSPAQTIGLKSGDLILELNDEKIHDFSEVKMNVYLSDPTKDLIIKVLREGKIETLILPSTGKEREILGIVADYKAPVNFHKVSLLKAFTLSVEDAYQKTKSTCIYLGQVLSGKRSADGLRGPIGIAEASGDAFKMGWIALLLFIVQISVGIGFMNLLPIPLLDGGHLTLYLIEAIFRRPISEKAQNVLMQIGMFLLLLLFAWTLLKDIPRLIQRIFG